jgi:hypothetical protein
MKHPRNLALVGLAAAAAVGLTATGASAATTTIHSGSASGPAYSGSVSADLLGSASVSTSIGSGTCTSSNMTGTVNSDGTALSISSATFSDGGSSACGGTVSATITAINLPWSGGNVTYAPVSGGADGTITIANFDVQAVVNIFGGITCDYGGSLTANAYNPNNPNRPNTSVSQAEAAINGGTVKKTGGSFFCPGTATVTATYQLTGSGGASLWVTS